MASEAELLERMVPATRAFSITPNDSANITRVSLIYVGGFGDLKVDTSGGDTVTLSNLPEGTVFPLFVKKVYSTGTTATNLVGIYAG